MNRLLRVFSSRWFWSMLGLVCLSCLVWWVGPLVSIAEWKPLESLWARVSVLVVCWLTFLFVLLFVLYRHRKAQRELEAGLQQGASISSRVGEANEGLSQKFAEALKVLRKVRAEESRGWLRRMLVTIDRQSYLYRMPWFAILGVPGSGKTTAVVHSGLKFPVGSESFDGVGGTRNCKWFFSDEAVLLDLAGRYCTHESDRLLDSAEWSHFLKLLKKTRARQPINGVVVSIAADTLLQGNKAELEIQGNAVRQRVQELQQELGVEVPVYLLVTKCDLVFGFMEFFDSLTQEERHQVWGVTLPLPEGAKGPVAFSQLPGMLEKLLVRVQELLPGKLQTENDLMRRSAMGVFPQSLFSIQSALLNFAESAFGPNAYQPRVLFRGVYLTSAAQQGQAIDPLFPVLPGALGVQESIVSKLGPHMSHRPFFLTRLFSDLILGESGLTAGGIYWSRKHSAIRIAGFAAVLSCFVIAVAAMMVAYSGNSGYIGVVDGRLPKTREAVDAITVSPDTRLVDLLPTLESVRSVATPEQTGRLFNLHGLGQSEKLISASSNAYQRMLEDTFLTQIHNRAEEGLTRYKNDPELLYETLKAYVMLHEPEHFNVDHFRAWVMLDWDMSQIRDIPPEQRKQLEAHLDQLLSKKIIQSKEPLRKELVNSVRTQIASVSLSARVYSRLKRLATNLSGVPPFRLTEVAGPSAGVVFVRASGAPLSQGVDGFFTIDGYRKAFLPELDQVLGELQKEEPWVLGVPAQSQSTAAALNVLGKSERPYDREKDQVKRLYLEEYGAAWEKFVSDVRIAPGRNLQQSVHLTRLISAMDSPLLYFLRGVARETSLGAATEGDLPDLEAAAKTVAGNVVDYKTKTQQERLRQFANLPANGSRQRAITRPEYMVDTRFEPIHRMVTPSSPGGPTPFDATMVLLSDYYNHLAATEAAIQAKGVLPQSDLPVRMKSEAQRMPAPVSGILQSLSETSTTNIQVQQRGNLSSMMNTSFGESCKQTVEDRYPFNRSNPVEVRRDDFVRYFAPGGALESFFQSNLAKDVDTSERKWVFKPIAGSSLPVDSSALLGFQHAQVIRNVFFSTGGAGANSPQLRFSIKPVEMGARVMKTVLDVGGQQIRYMHDATVLQNIVWPSPNGQSSVRLAMTSVTGEDIGSMSFDGEWSLWRVFDRAEVEATDRPETVRLVFKINNHFVKYEVTASTALNPFRMAELSQFKCPANL